MPRRCRKWVSPAELDRLDRRLAWLGRGVGAMRLRLGEGLGRLDEVGGVKGLGFPNLESYCREALGRAGRWGADVRGLARRLGRLPRLRERLVSGKLSSSMVELVARVATPEDEGDWIERAAAMRVRAMRAELMTRRAEVIDDETPSRVTISRSVDRIDAWAFERARMMVETVGGARGDEAIEAILAEGMTELLALQPEVEAPVEDDSPSWRAELRAIRETAAAAVESLTVVEGAEYESEAEIEWPADAVGIDRLLRSAARELAWRDVELAALGRMAAECGIWRILGFANFAQYCREHIGLAPSAMAARVALAKRMAVLPEIEAALVAGRIGYEAAATIARVAGRNSVDAWIARADALTVKLLREEVSAVELVARAEGLSIDGMGPPDAALMDDVRDLERSVIATVSDSRMSGGSEAEPTECEIDVPKTTLRMSVSEDVGRFWRSLEATHARLGCDESFVAFLVRSVTRSWSGALANDVAYAPIYLRDRWRCASPVCTRRSVTPHHVRFRSMGGGDEAENVIALCDICHLELVHENRLKVTGSAPDGLMWRAAGWAA